MRETISRFVQVKPERFFVRAPKLDVDRTIRYALKLDTAAATRQGWILEPQGAQSGHLEPLRKAPTKGYRVLDPSGPRQGPGDAGRR